MPSDHSPLFCSFLNLSNISRGRCLWKFNNSLISNSNFVNEMKALIQKVIFSLENETYLTDRIKWELLKYEIRKFPVISNDFFNLCENDLTEDEILISLKSMQNNKTPGNDGLTKEFYKTFWNEIKQFFLKSVKQAKEEGQLSISQLQAVIKLIEKKDRDKRYIKNWRSISLLNVDTKIISKALAAKLKKTLPTIISSNQTVYIK